MGTINIGRVRLSFQGAYNSSTAYTVHEVVFYNGESYACIQDASAGTNPTNTTHWVKLAQKGDAGPSGSVTVDTVSGNLNFADGGVAKFGDSGEFQISHTGSGNSIISETGGGSLYIDATNLYLRKSTSSGEALADFTADGAVTLYHNGSSKLATTSTGVNVTGTLTSDGLTVDSGTTTPVVNLSRSGSYSGITFSQTISNTTGAGADLITYSSNNDTGYVWQTTDSGGSQAKALLIAPNRDISFYEDTGTTAKFFWDSSAERLGIGTSSPSTPLAVHSALAGGIAIAEFRSTGNQHSTIDLRADGTGDPKILFDLNGASSFALGVDNSDGDKFKISGNYQLGTNDRFVIDSSGRVGIGTSSPARTLDVNGGGIVRGFLTLYGTGTNNALFLNNTSHEWAAYTDASNNFVIADWNVAQPRLTIDTSGRVGIGTSSPSANLHVSSSGDTIARITSADGNTAVLDLGDSSDPDGGRIFYDSGSNLGFTTQSAERMRIDSSGRVGIGTTSPDGRLDIEGDFEATKALVLNNTKGTGKVSYLRSHGLNGEALALYHDGNQMQRWESDGTIKFEGSGSERARIDSSGNLLVGTTAAYSSGGVTLDNSGVIYSKRSGGIGLYIDRETNDGTLAEFRKDGTTVGSIGSLSGTQIVIDSGGNRSGLRFEDNGLLPRKNSAMADGTVTLGNASYRFKDLHLSGTANAAKVNLADAGGTLRNVLDLDSSDNLKVGTGASAGSRSITFFTENTEQMRLDASGNLLVGTTDANVYNNTSGGGISLKGNGEFQIANTNDAPIWANRMGNDGEIINLRKDGSSIGSIGVDNSDNLTISGNAGHAGLNFSTAAVLPYKNGNYTNGTIDLGESSAARWKDLYMEGTVNIQRSGVSGATAQLSMTGAGPTVNASAGYHPLIVQSNGSEKLRLDSSGNLLVGTTDASPNNNSNQNSDANGIALRSNGVIQVAKYNEAPIVANRTGSDGNIIEMRKDGSTTLIGSIGTSGGEVFIGSGDTTLRFFAAGDAVLPRGTGGAQRDGLISLGAGSNRFKDLYMSGAANVGSVTATGNVTAYSDSRLKEDVRPIESAVSKVQQISGNTYTRNDLEDTERRYAGVIAQEVEQVLPEAVSEAEDGTKVVDYNATIALLVEAVKELTAEVNELKGGR